MPRQSFAILNKMVKVGHIEKVTWADFWSYNAAIWEKRAHSQGALEEKNEKEEEQILSGG